MWRPKMPTWAKPRPSEEPGSGPEDCSGPNPTTTGCARPLKRDALDLHELVALGLNDENTTAARFPLGRKEMGKSRMPLY